MTATWWGEAQQPAEAGLREKTKKTQHASRTLVRDDTFTAAPQA
jgi:hypothetical protein